MSNNVRDISLWEATKSTGLSESSLWRAIRLGTLAAEQRPPNRLGKYFVSRADLAKYLQGRPTKKKKVTS